MIIAWRDDINDEEKLELKKYIRGKILGEFSLEDNLDNFENMFKNANKSIISCKKA